MHFFVVSRNSNHGQLNWVEGLESKSLQAPKIVPSAYLGHGQCSSSKASQSFKKGPVESAYDQLIRSFDHGLIEDAVDTFTTVCAQVAT